MSLEIILHGMSTKCYDNILANIDKIKIIFLLKRRNKIIQTFPLNIQQLQARKMVCFMTQKLTFLAFASLI
jgi:hypothetical protein